jgi:glycine C-acetyltransferase
MMSGDSVHHLDLERQLAEFEKKEAAYLLNFGYQGMVSTIDVLCSRHDVIVYDSESHACIMDGVFLHKAKGGKSFVFPHNDIERCEKMLRMAEGHIEREGGKGGILLITEGVFGMAGDLGALDKIVALKKDYQFRILLDDAHGFGTLGDTGAGASELFGCMDEIEIYFGTFAKSMATIGAFIAGTREVIDHLRFNMRSQIFAKSLPMPIVIGAIKRLEMLKQGECRKKLWEIANAMQDGLRKNGLDIGNTESPVTPVYFPGDAGMGSNIVCDLRENYGIFCSMVVYPVVPKGVLMLRIIPTAAHSLEDVERTIQVFCEIKKKVEAGAYVGDVPMMNLRG